VPETVYNLNQEAAMKQTAVLLLAAGFTVLAQSPSANAGFGRTVFPGGSGPGSVGATSNAGFGRIVFPGTGAPAVLRPGVFPGPVFPILTGPVIQHQTHPRGAIVPIPVYYGGAGYYNYEPPPAQMIALPVAAPQPYYPVQQPAALQEQPPVVIISQYFRSDGAPETQTGTAAPPAALAPAPSVAPAPQQDDLRDVFLIAMKDHTIYAARSYWVEDGTLSYITIQGDQNSVSLDLVDRELSQRLNRDRKVAFGLPGN
jgi:hypothetical protein